MATRHLISLGHKRIAIITNAQPAYTASAARLFGYQQALQVAGLEYNDSLVRYGNFTPESGFKAMSELLDHKPLPSAVFVASDTVALGAMQAIRQKGLQVPDDLALVGFDDIPLAEFLDPPLTTVCLPAFGLGWGAAELLIRLISNEDIMEKGVILETELIVRASCGVNMPRKPHL
jgi:DNA-binding LacI/PurR family transcriptional regulator